MMLIDPDELIVDCFAGGGGASTGIEAALGRHIDIAINHDPDAIAVHAANHPKTRHFIENVWEVDIAGVIAGRKVGLAWFSPDCCHFSRAKGGKPVKKSIRGLAWVALKWAGLVKPRVIALENVEEFKTWGPVVDGQPCKRRSGMTFKRWVTQLRNLGYVVEWRSMRACDYGAPTIRKRLFIVARCDGQPIVWPEPTHAAAGDMFLSPYRTAAECIDWSIPCPSIFDRKRPLAEATMRRIARGIERYVINAKKPFIVNLTHGVRLEPIDEPLRTATGAHRGEKAVVSPTITRIGQTGGKGKYSNSVEEPLTTVTSKAEHLLVAPNLVRVAHGERDKNGKKRGRGEHAIEQPLPTMTGSADFALVTPFLDRQFGKSAGNDVAEPLGTTTAGGGGKSALICPTLVQTGYGERDGQEPRAPGLEKPLGTVVATGKHGLVTACISSYYGAKSDKDARGSELEEPIATVPTENRHALVSAFLAKHFGGQVGTEITNPLPTQTARGTQTQPVAVFLAQHNSERGDGVKAGRPADSPLSTITGTGGQQNVVIANLLHNTTHNLPTSPDQPLKTIATGGHHAIVASSLVKLRGTCKDGQPVDAPAATISAQGNHLGEVRAFLLKYFGTDQDPRLETPLHTITAKHRFGLVTVHGEEYQIVDIGMRMLSPRELFRAQGFPERYLIDRGRDQKTGRWRAMTKTAQIKLCGNSVSPPAAEAIVRAQFEQPEGARKVA